MSQEKETTMMKRILLTVSLAAIGLSVQAGAPMKVASVAPVVDLAAEAEAKIKILETALADDKSYTEGKGKTIPVAAGTLSVLAQAIVESDEKVAWSATAADVRDAAMTVASSKSYADAKAGLDAIKAAQGGKASGAKPDAEWKKLAKLGVIMQEVNTRNGKLRRNTRKIPDDAAEAARDASVLAVLALAAHDDTHEVKDAAKIPEWQKYSKEFSVQMTATAAALKAKDQAKASDGFKKANTACNDCHKVFRENE
jgi:hypothetical protein